MDPPNGTPADPTKGSRTARPRPRPAPDLDRRGRVAGSEHANGAYYLAVDRQPVPRGALPDGVVRGGAQDRGGEEARPVRRGDRGGLGFLAFLFHVHGLDCGATERPSRWRHHACDKGRPQGTLGCDAGTPEPLPGPAADGSMVLSADPGGGTRVHSPPLSDSLDESTRLDRACKLPQDNHVPPCFSVRTGGLETSK